MELLLPSQTDSDIIGKFETIIDLWYGLQLAVRKFAEWTKGRMDCLTEFLEDIEFSSVSDGLQLPEDAKVNVLATLQQLFFVSSMLTPHMLLLVSLFLDPSICM